MQSGRPFRPWDEQPVLARHLKWVMEAFGELMTCKGERGRIPWTAVHAYAEAKGVGDRTRFEHLIRACEDAFEGHLKRQREQTVNRRADG